MTFYSFPLRSYRSHISIQLIQIKYR